MRPKQVAILDTGYESYEYEQDLFAQHGFELIIYKGEARNKQAKYEFAREASGLLVRELLIDQDALGIMPRLEAIVRYGVGYDNIDLETTRKSNPQWLIKLMFIKHYSTQAVFHFELFIRS